MSRRVHRCASLLASLALCVLARSGRADDANADAEDHVRRGVELRNQNRDREALAEFEAAWSLLPTPRTRAQIALAEQALGEWVEAERGIEDALHSREDPWIARYREALERARAVIQEHLGWLWVESNVERSEVAVDGKSSSTPAQGEPLRVPSGPVVIEVRAPGYAAARRTVIIPPRGLARASLLLRPLLHAPSPVDALVPPVARTPIKSEPVVRSSWPALSARAGAVLSLSAAGVLSLAGFAAWRVRLANLNAYNDDSRCVVGGLSREERCGPYRAAADGAYAVEAATFAAAGLATVGGAWLLVTSSSSASGDKGGPLSTTLDRVGGGMLVLGGAGLLSLVGIGAWRLRIDDIAIYNDNSRCVVGNQTREERCGSYRAEAGEAAALEVTSFVAAGLAAVSGLWLLAVRGAHPPADLACAPSLGGVRCAARF